MTRLFVSSAWLLFLTTFACAQQLSIRHYDVSDGLAHSHVSAMHQDAKGYLWIATWEGLSRFDGYRFKNYGAQDGLGDSIINDIAEDRKGHLWVATNGGGVARLIDSEFQDDNPKQRFVSFQISNSARANRVNTLLFDSQNNLWCATDGGLFRSADAKSFTLVVPYEGEASMVACADRQGRLWFGMDDELIEIVGDQVSKYGAAEGIGKYKVTSVIEDQRGRILVANEHNVFELTSNSNTNLNTWRQWPIDLRSDQGINSLLSDSSGALWIGTWNGLIKYVDGKQTLYTNAQGLSDNHIAALTEDHDKNLWIGSIGGGVCKLSSEMIVSFTRAEGLPNQDVRKVIEDRAGNVYASIEHGGLVTIVEGRAVSITGSEAAPFSNVNERIFQDRRGDWWIGTDVGLFHVHGPELRLAHAEKMTQKDGLPERSILGGLYEDRDGRIWASPEGEGLFCLTREGNQINFQQVPQPSVLPFTGFQRLIDDNSGTLWLAGHELLGRLVDSRAMMLQPVTGLPETRPRCFFVDSRGWLWIGLRYRGVSVTKEPGSPSPQFINYSTANGLASDAVWTVSEDDQGRMYFGTGKGLDQLDLTTGRIRHFNTDDGLVGDIVNYCLKDREGNIWAGTTLGLSKFNPHAERINSAPVPIYLSRISVAGEDLRLPETGVEHFASIELPATRNNLTIEYVAISFRGDDELRYQYKLEGVDNDWSSLTDARSINYARLAPGSYKFMVRAVDQAGLGSSEPASFQFRILPPVWQRWWFVLISLLVVALIVYALYRQRLARVLELERVRTRIATDLHDDIGANLSLIAMLSEVSRGQLKNGDSLMKEWLSTIATTSRDTVDAMSDIVWAVNPNRDHLLDLTRRMRRFADDIFAPRNIEFTFQSPDSGDIRLGADLRREVFLIFKETINNAARHSGCSTTSVLLRVEDRQLLLEVCDNGHGLTVAPENHGTGLASMQARAQRLGGIYEVVSRKKEGTRVTLRVPLDRRARV